jgi:hypothetical protein
MRLYNTYYMMNDEQDFKESRIENKKPAIRRVFKVAVQITSFRPCHPFRPCRPYHQRQQLHLSLVNQQPYTL